MRAVLKREFRAYFQSPLGFVFIAALYFFTAYYFFTFNLYRNTTDMSNLFDQLFTVVLFLVPVLTMRLMSEDKRARTDQLLLTAPVSRIGIVLGKYLSALLVYLIAISGTLLMAVVMSFYASPDWPVVIGNLIGLVMLGASLIAICMFLSSLTESQVIAAVCGFAASLSLVLVDAMADVVSSAFLKRTLYYLSFNNHYNGFTIGIIDISNILFFLSVLIVLLIAAVVLLNAVALVLANRYPLSLDLTANAAYEIGSDTKTILAGLSDDVTIDVLSDENAFSQDAYLMQAKRILDQYPRYSERVKLRYIDYAADPSYAASHPDLTLADSDVIVSANGRVKQVALTSLFNYAYTATGSITIESSRAEEAVTGAIQYVLSGESVQIGVLSGNGEQSVENFTSLLVNNNYTLKSAVPATDDLSVYDALLLIAPQTDLSEDDIRALEAYLYNGGSYGKTLFYTASVTQTELPNIETFLAEWGVAFGDGVVFETKSDRTYQYQPFYPVADYVSETYKKMLIDASAPMLMPLSKPMQTLFTSRDGQYTETLLSFAETAGVRPPDAGESFTAADATTWGPMPAMVLASRKVVENGMVSKQSNIVVSASTAMLDEICMQNSSLSNSTYVLNLMNSLTDRGEMLAIAPKSLAGKTLGITSRQVTTLGVVLGGILPLLILLTGIGVWLYRRYK